MEWEKVNNLMGLTLEHVIWIVFLDTISVTWSERAGQLAAGGVASVWR